MYRVNFVEIRLCGKVIILDESDVEVQINCHLGPDLFSPNG